MNFTNPREARYIVMAFAMLSSFVWIDTAVGMVSADEAEWKIGLPGFALL